MADEKEKARQAEDELHQKSQSGLGSRIRNVQLNAQGDKSIAQHTVSAGETLSHIALKHYGNAGRDFWMAIYEANKQVIGDNPGLIRPGMVLSIPEKK